MNFNINLIDIKAIVKEVLEECDLLKYFTITTNQSPLRYPGGKSKACKILNDILSQNFDISKYEYIISPFFGGGSFEFHIQNTYNKKIIANDKFQSLYNFWVQCQTNKKQLCAELTQIQERGVVKEDFLYYRNQIQSSLNLKQAIAYFVLNRCSFSGTTLSGGFSNEASQKRFTFSSIQKIEELNLINIKFHGLDFEEFINIYYKDNVFIFLDPPYYLTSKLYGNNGDLHEYFDHIRLFNILENKKNWMMTYNNCDFIKILYGKFTIIEVDWTYGMNKSKESSEIIIISK